MSIVRQCNVIVEGLSFANFIAEFYSGGVAVRAVFSYGVAYDRELEEYVFCALVFNGTVYTFQFGYETFVYAIYNDAFSVTSAMFITSTTNIQQNACHYLYIVPLLKDNQKITS